MLSHTMVQSTTPAVPRLVETEGADGDKGRMEWDVPDFVLHSCTWAGEMRHHRIWLFGIHLARRGPCPTPCLLSPASLFFFDFAQLGTIVVKSS